MARAIFLILVISVPTSPSDTLTELTGQTMGTRYSVKLPPNADPNAYDTVHDTIRTRLAEINQRMSTYDPQSEVSRFNRADSGQWIESSAETVRLVRRANEIAQQTDGAFDVTVGPLIRLWQFGEHADPLNLDARRTAIPDVDAIRNVLAMVGYQKLQTRLEPPALRKTVTGVEIDLSAIAKGYAVDEVGRILSEAGHLRWMIEIGGEVLVRGTKPDGTAWKIGIESPTPGRRHLELVVAPEDSAIATSGDYRNYFEFNNVRYSHTIDPRTGRPVDHDLASVTVSSPDCATADALATGILVMGPDQGLTWSEQHQVAALLLSRDANGIQRRHSASFHILVPDQLADTKPTWVRIALMSLLVFAAAMTAMAIGVIVSNRRIKGSCGGLAGMQDEHGNSICDACSDPPTECRVGSSRWMSRKQGS